jgi:hypothetical protein
MGAVPLSFTVRGSAMVGRTDFDRDVIVPFLGIKMTGL